ncbi:MAG: diaminopimelate epimerase [Acidobacteria bacterium]|nr:diaminopimelate epimerase [Acidobacteriota bacterium]
MRLAKAHGLGNDFLLLARAEASGDRSILARRLCGRHTGVGADGLILFEAGAGGVTLELVNADGSDAEISGNGLRCLAAYVVARGLAPVDHVVRTVAGPRPVAVETLGASRYRVSTGLGAPLLASDAIPVALAPPAARVVDHPLNVRDGEVRVTATSLGNPHCAVFCDEPASDVLVTRLGPALETHGFFPRRTNVEFVTVVRRDELRVRFWERGVGPTLASGTGAASAAVAAILNGRAERRVRVVCDGGVLDVEWPEGGPVRQVGEVELLFEGEWLAATSS